MPIGSGQTALIAISALVLLLGSGVLPAQDGNTPGPAKEEQDESDGRPATEREFTKEIKESTPAS